MDIPREWASHRMALSAARMIATTTGEHQRVIREDGHNATGPFHFRILAADACSCTWWTECVGPGLNLPCAEQHHSCPVHPMDTFGNVPVDIGVAEPCS